MRHAALRPDRSQSASREQTLTAHPPSRCPACHTPLPPGATSCSQCGAAINTASHAATRATTDATISQAKLITIITVIALLTIAAISAAVIIAQNSENSDAASGPATATQTVLFRGDPGRSGIIPGGGRVESNEVLWKARIGGDDSHMAPVAFDDTVLAVGADGGLYALNRYDGAEKWVFTESEEIITVPVVRGNMIYVGSQDGQFYALESETGQVLWSLALSDKHGGVICSHPLVLDDSIIVSAWNIDLIALDPETGEEKWRYVASDSSGGRTNGMVNSPAAADGAIYNVIGNDKPAIYAVDARTGQEVWKRTGIFTQGSPSLHNGKLYLLEHKVTGDYSLVALDPADGSTIGRLAKSSSSGYGLFDGGRVILPGSYPLSATSYMYDLKSFSLVHGELFWRLHTGDSMAGEPVMSDGYLYYTSNDFDSDNGSLYAADAMWGEMLWQARLDAGPLSTPAVAGAVAYIKSADGYLFAIGNPENLASEAGGQPGDIRSVDWAGLIGVQQGLDYIEGVHYGDLDGDGAEEAIVLHRMDGTGLILNVYIYRYRGDRLIRVFAREGVPKGGVDPRFADQGFIISQAAPDGDEPNCCPRNFLRRTYTWEPDSRTFSVTSEELIPNPQGWQQ